MFWRVNQYPVLFNGFTSAQLCFDGLTSTQLFWRVNQYPNMFNGLTSTQLGLTG